MPKHYKQIADAVYIKIENSLFIPLLLAKTTLLPLKCVICLCWTSKKNWLALAFLVLDSKEC